ncbi:MAG: 4Fe-4S binding protein [Anaerolineae bacterium]|nr:4Fe-4S binding protein [Anaerolineae bacterium]
MTNGTGHTRIALMIDEDRCQVCDVCLAKSKCKGNAIRIIDKGEVPFLDMSRCWGCMVCMTACVNDAIVRRDGEK